MNYQSKSPFSSHKNSQRLLHKRASDTLSAAEEPITKASIREAMLSSLIKQSNNVSMESEGEDETFDESELKASKLLDLTTEENTKFFESQFTSKMDFTPAEDKVDGWRFLAQQILNPISSWQNALNKLKERKRVNLLMKSKLPPVAYLKQSCVMTGADSPFDNGRRKSLSPFGPNELTRKSHQICFTRRGVAQLIPVPDHLIRTFHSEEKFGAKVLQLENDLEELEEDHQHALKIFKSMRKEASKLLKDDHKKSCSPLPFKYIASRSGALTPEPPKCATPDPNPLSTFYVGKSKISEPQLSSTVQLGEGSLKKSELNTSRVPSPLGKKLTLKTKKAVNAKNFITLNKNMKASRTNSPKQGKSREIGKSEQYKEFLEGESLKKSGQKHRKLPSVTELKKRIPKIYGRVHRKHRVSIDCQKFGSKSACKLMYGRDLEVTPLSKVGAGRWLDQKIDSICCQLENGARDSFRPIFEEFPVSTVVAMSISPSH